MKNYRYVPLNADQKHDLELLLKEVPTETIVHTQWNSPEGRTFIKAVRELQLKGVSAPSIAEQLGLQASTLQGAIRYWERVAPSKGKKRVRQRRPLGRSAAGEP